MDLSPDCYTGVVVGQGTTNVDFNSTFVGALAQIRDGESVSFAIGQDEVTLLRGSEQFSESKVDLPVRWVKGFCEMQAFEARMRLRFKLGGIETLRFLRSIPASTTNAAAFWIVPAGPSVRISQAPAENGVRITGIERLRLLLDLAPYATGLQVFADAQNVASEWVLALGAVRFHLAVSAEVWRGFSGEGQALAALARPVQEADLQEVGNALHWQAVLQAAELGEMLNMPHSVVAAAIATLASQGLAGYDVISAAHFHRELPFHLHQVESMHPRLQSALKLVDANAVTIRSHREDMKIEAEVTTKDAVHSIKLDAESFKCTCPWYAQYQSERGPCKHVIAVQITVGQNADA